jgi:hypothetical protein
MPGWRCGGAWPGIEITLSQHWRLEPHYLGQEDSRSEPGHTNACGVILKYFN